MMTLFGARARMVLIHPWTTGLKFAHVTVVSIGSLNGS